MAPPPEKAANNLSFDRALANSPPERRWQEWMSRVEAVIFTSPFGAPDDAPHRLSPASDPA